MILEALGLGYNEVWSGALRDVLLITRRRVNDGLLSRCSLRQGLISSWLVNLLKIET